MRIVINSNIYKMAPHGRNVVYSVLVLFDHFILLNGQGAELPLQHRISAISRCVGSLLHRNKEAPCHTFSVSLLD